jgi:hypothetical protein
MFPFVPFTSFFVIVSGIVTWAWYAALSAADKSKFDKLVAYFGYQLYQKSIEKLSDSERSQVIDMARNHWKT